MDSRAGHREDMESEQPTLFPQLQQTRNRRGEVQFSFKNSATLCCVSDTLRRLPDRSGAVRSWKCKISFTDDSAGFGANLQVLTFFADDSHVLDKSHSIRPLLEQKIFENPIRFINRQLRETSASTWQPKLILIYRCRQNLSIGLPVADVNLTTSAHGTNFT